MLRFSRGLSGSGLTRDSAMVGCSVSGAYVWLASWPSSWTGSGGVVGAVGAACSVFSAFPFSSGAAWAVAASSLAMVGVASCGS